jgi:hypothetical protein
MTNLPAIVAITLLTNLTEDVHQDGSRKTVVETVNKQCIHHWVEDGAAHSHTNISLFKSSIRRFRRVWQPIEVTPPPFPKSSSTRNPFLIPEPLQISTNDIESLRSRYRSRDGNVTNIYIGPLSSMLLQSVVPLVPDVTNTVIVSPRFANGTDTNEPTADYCRMFRVDFATETNWIYGLESSNELANWTLCPPEIDGTGQPDYFFDVDSEHKSYRLVLREGVLPEE